MRVYEALASAMAAEDVNTHFGLMGDGNMHFMAAMDQIEGMRSVSVRHEHCALLMAVGYWDATGRLGVCSVTHGPGFTQLMTGLATAARNNASVVVIAGETGLGAPWSVQSIDQAPLARACGAEYLPVHSVEVLHYRIREAFDIARTDSKPVVLGIPIDVMKSETGGLSDYEPSLAHRTPATPVPPDQAAIADLAARLLAARAPLLVAGRGALHSGAAEAIAQLADETGALLGTTLLGKGVFDGHAFSLGIVGGYISEAGRQAARDMDLVVAFGAQLSRFTLDSGKLFGGAMVVQVDIAPRALKEGMVAADHMLRGDARLAAEALLDHVRAAGAPAQAGVRTDSLARRLRDLPADCGHFAPPEGLADPRAVFDVLEAALPAGYRLVSGSAHQAYWHTTMAGIAGGNYHAIRAFGAIGNALSFATGIAVARNDGKVILSEGDGGLLMHIQELETIVRERIKLLIICINDGGFGAEIHKLRADGVSDAGAIFGQTDLAGIARSFGLGAATITDPDQVTAAFEQFEADDRAWLWDVKVSDRQRSPPMRRALAATGARP